MALFASVILCLAFLVVAGLRAERLLARVLDLIERRVPAPQEHKSDPLPPDLLQYAAGFDAEWARNDVLDRCYELYSKYDNWDRVRMALAVTEQVQIQETS